MLIVADYCSNHMHALNCTPPKVRHCCLNPKTKWLIIQFRTTYLDSFSQIFFSTLRNFYTEDTKRMTWNSLDTSNRYWYRCPVCKRAWILCLSDRYLDKSKTIRTELNRRFIGFITAQIPSGLISLIEIESCCRCESMFVWRWVQTSTNLCEFLFECHALKHIGEKRQWAIFEYYCYFAVCNAFSRLGLSKHEAMYCAVYYNVIPKWWHRRQHGDDTRLPLMCSQVGTDSRCRNRNGVLFFRNMHREAAQIRNDRQHPEGSAKSLQIWATTRLFGLTQKRLPQRGLTSSLESANLVKTIWRYGWGCPLWVGLRIQSSGSKTRSQVCLNL